MRQVAAGTIAVVGRPARRSVPGSLVVARPEARDRRGRRAPRPQRQEATAPRRPQDYRDTAFRQVPRLAARAASRAGLTDALLDSLTELHGQGWAHSIEVWLDEVLVGGAMGIGICGLMSGDSLFGRYPGAARSPVADMWARLRRQAGRVARSGTSPFSPLARRPADGARRYLECSNRPGGTYGSHPLATAHRCCRRPEADVVVNASLAPGPAGSPGRGW